MAIAYRLSIVFPSHRHGLVNCSSDALSFRPSPIQKKPKTPSLIPNAVSASSSSSPVLLMRRRRRMLNLSIIGVIFLWDPISGSLSRALTEEALELERFTYSNEGFTLLVPNSWIKVEKAGATVLFEEPNKGSSNNLGVVVSPVRISKLSDFGSPQFVADKLIQAEKRKESTKSAQVISVSERSGQGGLQVYEFEYIVDSTRGGMKRVFSAAFASSKKLYLLNISHADGLEKPLDMNKRMALEKVLHSFDVASST